MVSKAYSGDAARYLMYLPFCGINASLQQKSQTKQKSDFTKQRNDQSKVNIVYCTENLLRTTDVLPSPYTNIPVICPRPYASELGDSSCTEAVEQLSFDNFNLGAS